MKELIEFTLLKVTDISSLIQKVHLRMNILRQLMTFDLPKSIMRHFYAAITKSF